MKLVISSCALVAGVALNAATCVYDSESGVTDLASAQAWVGGTVPGAEDVAVFDGEIAGTLTLGAATEWAGVIRTNSVNEVTLVAPQDGTLTLGAEGVKMYKTPDDWRGLLFDADLILAADQTWMCESKRTIRTNRKINGTGKLTIAKPSTVIFDDAVTAQVTVQRDASLYFYENASLNPAPTVNAGGNLVVVNTPKPNGIPFADLFPDRTFLNEGRLFFGGTDKSTTHIHKTNTVFLSAGDALKGPAASGTSDRANGHILVMNTHIVNDGADVTDNVWFSMRNGSWTQKSGDTAFSYAGIVGRGLSKGYGVPGARLSIENGTFKTRRMSIGLGNGDEFPAEMFVTGGVYESTLLNDLSWANVTAIALRNLSGDTSESDFASGRLEISGGRFKTPGLYFGSENSGDGLKDANSGARLKLSGGLLEVGNGGIRPAASWKDVPSSIDRSWYDAILSGGTLRFYKATTDSQGDMCLSDRDGGVSVEVPSGITDVRISGSLYGEGGLRKTGPGCLRLTGANDYTGRTVVAEGRLAYGNNFETAVWTADSLASLADGAPAVPWTTCGVIVPSDSWSFTLGTTIVGTEGTTAPTLVRNAMNGHAVLAFDGNNTCFLTGNATQPFSEKSEFTVSMVIRTEPGFAGNASAEFQTATQIFGTSMVHDSNARRYGISIDDQGRVGCGMFEGAWMEKDPVTQQNKKVVMPPENLWSDVAVNDGNPHVIVWTWQHGKQHVLRVDDKIYRMSSPNDNADKVIKTRIVLGVGERQDASKRFRGQLADLRMAAMAITETRGAELVRELGMKYGVAGFDDVQLWNDIPAYEAAAVPEATASWCADTLAQSAGQAVASWPERNGKGNGNGSAWTFTQALADTILAKQSNYPGSTAAPVIASDTVGGHKLVSFDGVTSGLALTGSSATPVGYNGDGLTVAMVVRFPKYGTGGEAFTPLTANPFFGTAFGMTADVENWQLLISGAGRVGVAHCRDSWVYETMRSRQRFLNDGEAHVIVARYPKKDATGGYAVFVDGYKDESANLKMKKDLNNTRILLGCSEYGSARYATVDVAEFSFWRNSVLSDAQVRSLTEQLAATYSLELPAYTRGVAASSQQCSREVVLAAGTTFGGIGNFGATLYPGQTLWGAGNVTGLLTLAPGAAVKATTESALTFDNGIEFMDGAVLAGEFSGEAAMRPMTVTGNVYLRGVTTVRLDPGDAQGASGALLTWTGDVVSSDSEPAFVLEGVSSSSARVKLDRANKCLRIVRTGGLKIIIR